MKYLYDALIVGAGPAGSYIAGELASQGHRVLVFEQQGKIGKATCCTGIVGKECFDTFPIGREAILREARSARFFIPSGESFRLEKEATQAYIIDRHAFDAAMARRAQEEGAEYLMIAQVKDISLEKDFVRLEVNGKDQKANFEGKVVVIASGFSSRLAQSLGLGRSSDFVMGAQAEVETNETDEVEVYFGNHIAPGFFAWLVPTYQGRALAGLLSRHNTGSYLRNFLAELSERGKIITPEVEIKYGGIPLKPLSKTSKERLLVVGDAAGQVKPTTGGGIYFGLLSARIAADTLHQALCDNNFTAKEFNIYEKKWRAMLSRELRIDYVARRMFERLEDKQIERAFHQIQAKHILESLLDSTDFSFDWHSRLILRGAKRLGVGWSLSLIWQLLRERLLRSRS